MTSTDQLLENNKTFAQSFEPTGLPAPPRRKVAVVACMDARLDPAQVLGLSSGDAHVIRNAGGVVTDDVIRSLAISQHELGTEEVVLIHHTGCGMIGLDDEEFAAALERHSGERPSWQAQGFHDLDEDVRESIRRIATSPFMKHTDGVRGFVYELDSGLLREVS
jgi:carbonic anhydrase